VKPHDYRDLIAAYIDVNYGPKGVVVYTEVSLGKTIIGKNRRIDVFVLRRSDQRALALETKYQEVQGTTDEKIPYALQDLEALWFPGCLASHTGGLASGRPLLADVSRPHSKQRDPRARSRACRRLRLLGPGNPRGASILEAPAVVSAAQGTKEGGSADGWRTQEGCRGRGLTGTRGAPELAIEAVDVGRALRDLLDAKVEDGAGAARHEEAAAVEKGAAPRALTPGRAA